MFNAPVALIWIPKDLSQLCPVGPLATAGIGELNEPSHLTIGCGFELLVPSTVGPNNQRSGSVHSTAWPRNSSMAGRLKASLSETKLIEVPEAPARPVRPIR